MWNVNRRKSLATIAKLKLQSFREFTQLGIFAVRQFIDRRPGHTDEALQHLNHLDSTLEQTIFLAILSTFESSFLSTLHQRFHARAFESGGFVGLSFQSQTVEVVLFGGLLEHFEDSCGFDKFRDGTQSTEFVVG